MNLFLKKHKLIGLVAVVILAGACTPAVTPVEQIHQAQRVKEPMKTVTTQIGQASEVVIYRCKNDKKVEVERQNKTSNFTKKEMVTVSFQGISHQLSAAVTKNGKKYTNIRWTWHETRDGKAFLYNNTKKTLAANCVKQ